MPNPYDDYQMNLALQQNAQSQYQMNLMSHLGNLGQQLGNYSPMMQATMQPTPQIVRLRCSYCGVKTDPVARRCDCCGAPL
jgi:hypothetical protein